MAASSGAEDSRAKRARHAGASPRNPTIDWRSGRLSDWSVCLGARTYRLHAFILARGSHFFEGHTSLYEQTGAKRESDITELLPRVCHDCFESVLDFLYSEDQGSFEILPSHAMLLLKSADVLGMPKLMEAAISRIRAAQTESSLFLMQYHQLHIPGTDESKPLQELVDTLTSEIIKAFQRHLFSVASRGHLLQLPVEALRSILESDDLMVMSEDEVVEFVSEYCHASEFCERFAVVVWDCVRWEHIGAAKFDQLLSSQQCQLPRNVMEAALRRRVRRFALAAPAVLPKPRVMRPPRAGSPSALDIDLCFQYYPDLDANTKLRSEPLQIGDFVCRLLVFPRGTPAARHEHPNGVVSAFLEAVPQGHWPNAWKFKPIKYHLTCFPWSMGAATVQKHDSFSFCKTREDGEEGLDRGWHDFLTVDEMYDQMSPDGLLMIRGSLKHGTLSSCFFD
mmetsp:Transcript_117711/g.327807  ORF Transcript_117711/g.327807 Transcript_117711/m.327807 type:complete len:451 (-) Transcript_117711:56-1408(-)